MAAELATAVSIAHQGGWDEILLVAGPLAVFGGALWLANKRANANLAAQAAADDDAGDEIDAPTAEVQPDEA